jgi:ADP-heptose:LPS heptosyltransferase
MGHKIKFIINKLYSYSKMISHLLLLLSLKLFRIYKRDSLEQKTLALVRLDAIGDFILWLQSAKYYRKIYPEYKITLFCNSIYQDLAINCNLFDVVYPININIINHMSLRKNILKKFNYLYNLSTCFYEILICDMYSRGLNTSEAVSFLLHAQTKITITGDYSNISRKQKAMTNYIYDKITTTKDEVFEINKNFDFIKQLSKYKIEPRFEAIDNLFNIALKNKFTQPYITINLGASIISKIWPVTNFAKLINQLPNVEQYQIILIGSNNERELAKEFINLLITNNIINMVGRTSLLESMAIIKFSQFVVGNDSSSVHMATSLNVKSVAILGGGHFGRFLPYNIHNIEAHYNLPTVIYKKMECFSCNWQCMYPLDNDITWRCINQIQIDDVLSVIKHITLER